MKMNGKNERVKRAYFHYLSHAKRKSDDTVAQVAAALDRFEDYTKRRDFAAFRDRQAMGFKDYLKTNKSDVTGKPLGLASQHTILSSLRAFIIWLANQPGYRSKISLTDADYFNLSAKEVAIVKTDRASEGPSVEQVRHVILSMPHDTDIENRNRAMIALALLTAARVNALASVCLKHLDIGDRRLHQDARDVRTKASKTITTWFFPVGEDIFTIVAGWADHLRGHLLYGPDDPPFPSTKVAPGADRLFEAVGFERACWTTGAPVRQIFRDAFELAGQPYYHPHLFRKTLARLGAEKCATPEEYKAWSQNLGHDHVLTTFTSYGEVPATRQRDIIGDMWKPKASAEEKEERVRQAKKLLEGI